MIKQNRQLVTDELVEVQDDCRKLPVIHRIYPNLIKEKPEGVNILPTGWTCKHQDLNRLLCLKISPITGLNIHRKNKRTNSH